MIESGLAYDSHQTEIIKLAGQGIDNEIDLSKNFCQKNPYLFRVCYLGFDWSGWIVLIKIEILIRMGMASSGRSVLTNEKRGPWYC